MIILVVIAAFVVLYIAATCITSLVVADVLLEQKLIQRRDYWATFRKIFLYYLFLKDKFND